MRGRKHLLGEHVAHLESSGMRIIPRLEATLPKELSKEPPAKQRAAFGNDKLDELLRGGLPLKSTTLLAGSTGAGKTLTALHFAAKGAREGEPALYFSFSEPPEDLIARGDAIGLDVAHLVRAGNLRIIHRPLVELESDDIADEVIAHVKRMRARRLVVDGIGEVVNGISNPARARAFLTALIVHLRDLDVTTVFIKEVPKIAGPDVDFSDTPAAIVAENMMLLRQVEVQGRLRRVMSILKVRGSEFDPHLREYAIDSSGIHVLDPLETFEGLLTGIGRRLPEAAEEA
jgi:circadian clock protein KaiC